MEMKEVSAAAAILSILVISFAIAPLVLATVSNPNYPFELTGRVEYVAPSGTPNPFGHVGQAIFDLPPQVVLAESFTWVPASSYSTSPGHGL